jgi:hypothetical protein
MEGRVRRGRAVSRKPAKAQQTIKAKRGTASKVARNRRPSRFKQRHRRHAARPGARRRFGAAVRDL